MTKYQVIAVQHPSKNVLKVGDPVDALLEAETHAAELREVLMKLHSDVTVGVEPVEVA